jgi:hypothetical protein
VTGPAEFCLALECCRYGFKGSDSCCDILDAEVDWHQFLRLVRYHRIEGLAWNRLASLPIPIANTMKDAASAVAAQNLQAIAESWQLLNRFEAAKVRLLFLKGLTLGALAYGNPALKQSVDIDVLIRPENLAEAARLLRECGYRLVLPLSGKRLHPWHRTRKESVWVKDGSSLHLDLHTRTADNWQLIPSITAASASREVEISDGVALPTLTDDDLFAYLAVHGASSAWFRLKWIADFAGLVHEKASTEIERLYRRSQELRAGRAAGQALLLADALFGTLKGNPDLRQELGHDPATRLLFRAALRQVSGDAVGPTDRRFGTIAIHWTQFLLLPGLHYKWSELVGQPSRALARSRF